MAEVNIRNIYEDRVVKIMEELQIAVSPQLISKVDFFD